MASTIITEFKDACKVSIKPGGRSDNMVDQIHRMIYPKVMMCLAAVGFITWFQDDINCIIPKSSNLKSSDYVAQACWIQGFYVFQNLWDNPIGYYGIPIDIDMDGKHDNGKLCRVDTGKDDHYGECKPLERMFYTQYQFLPFIIAVFCCLYYAPYIIHKRFNDDFLLLMDTLIPERKDGGKRVENSNEEQTDIVAKKIAVELFLNKKVNPSSSQYKRVAIEGIVKCLYILSNVGAFLLADSVLYGKFNGFGLRWQQWHYSGSNQETHAYYWERSMPKAADTLLPSFGICEVQESARDFRHKITNRHAFVCEMSQNVLYHYVFLLLWWMIHIGFCMSIVNIFVYIAKICMIAITQRNKTTRKLKIREFQYLQYLGDHNQIVHDKVLKILKQSEKEARMNEM